MALEEALLDKKSRLLLTLAHVDQVFEDCDVTETVTLSVNGTRSAFRHQGNARVGCEDSDSSHKPPSHELVSKSVNGTRAAFRHKDCSVPPSNIVDKFLRRAEGLQPGVATVLLLLCCFLWRAECLKPGAVMA